jgi:hypothetical protein
MEVHLMIMNRYLRSSYSYFEITGFYHGGGFLLFLIPKRKEINMRACLCKLGLNLSPQLEFHNFS